MTSRQAKKLCLTPWNEMAPRWVNILLGDGNPPTIKNAMKKYNRIKQQHEPIS